MITFYHIGLAIHFFIIAALVASSGFDVGIDQWSLMIASLSWGLGLFIALFASKIAAAAASDGNDKIDYNFIIVHKNSKKYNRRSAKNG